MCDHRVMLGIPGRHQTISGCVIGAGVAGSVGGTVGRRGNVMTRGSDPRLGVRCRAVYWRHLLLSRKTGAAKDSNPRAAPLAEATRESRFDHGRRKRCGRRDSNLDQPGKVGATLS